VGRLIEREESCRERERERERVKGESGGVRESEGVGEREEHRLIEQGRGWKIYSERSGG
jgi:hypothetical protein